MYSKTRLIQRNYCDCGTFGPLTIKGHLRVIISPLAGFGLKHAVHNRPQNGIFRKKGSKLYSLVLWTRKRTSLRGSASFYVFSLKLRGSCWMWVRQDEPKKSPSSTSMRKVAQCAYVETTLLIRSGKKICIVQDNPDLITNANLCRPNDRLGVWEWRD